MRRYLSILCGMLMLFGAEKASAWVISNGTGNLTLGGALTLPGNTQTLTLSGVGFPSVTNSLLYFNESLTGSASATGGVAANYIAISSDNVNASGIAAASGYLNGLWLVHNFGGAGTEGSRSGGNFAAVLTSATGNAAAGGANNGQYVGVVGIGHAETADGGTGGSPYGAFFGIAGLAYADSAATNLYSVTNELDAGVASGGSASRIAALNLTNGPSGGVHGTAEDTYLGIYSAGQPMNDGIAFGCGGCDFPTSSTGVLIYADPTSAGSIVADRGIDMSAVTFTTAFLKSTGFLVSPTGAMTLSGAAPEIHLTNGTSNWIDLGTAGSGAPAFTTRSAGTRLILFNAEGASSVDYGFGIGNSALWSSVGTSAASFLWYAGSAQVGSLSGTGALQVSGTILSGGYAGSGGTAIPTCNTGLKGARAYVTDGATTPTFLGTYTAGAGAVTAPVFCNGSNWVYG